MQPHRYVVFGRAPYYCPEMPFYVATVLVLCALGIAWWGLPKVVIDRRRGRRYVKSVGSNNVSAGGEQVWELGRERLLQSIDDDEERIEREERGASYKSPSRVSFRATGSAVVGEVMERDQVAPCTPENLRRLSSQRSISFDLNDTTGTETPEELRAQRIERLLSVDTCM